MKWKRYTVSFWTTAGKEESIKALYRMIRSLGGKKVIYVDSVTLLVKKWWEFWKL